MRGLAAHRLREGLGVIGFSVTASLGVLLVNIVLMGVFLFAMDRSEGGGHPTAAQLSEALAVGPGGYEATPQMEQALRASGCWAMLIDEGGRVAWDLDRPSDVPERYTPADVASFSRWYLGDYPVTCWRHEGGLVVVGSPKDSVWKYPLESRVETMGLTLLLVASFFLADLVVLVALARGFAHRSWKQRDDARNEWVAAVSHDVRTPLAAVVADAATLAESPSLDEEGRVRASRIVVKSQETAGLLADLNSANRLRYAMEPVDARPVHLAAVARSVVAGRMDEVGDAHELELDVDPAAEGLCVRGSEVLLARMVSNLVGNSIRHNPQGCRVTVSLGLREGLLGGALGRRLVLTVSDDGRGFGKDALSTLRRRPGDELPEHGLGLVIVRRIATSHGGRATFSNAEGGGGICSVELPVAMGAPARRQPPARSA